MSNDTGYVHASHVKQVVSASSKSGTAIAVLLAAVSPFYVDFKKPETTFTKDDMCELLNAGRRAIAIALKELREEARERRFRSLARKFGAVPALEMMKDE